MRKPALFMNAAVLVAIKQPLTLMDNICVTAPQYGQVLVKMHYAGLCHSQLMELDGLRGEDKYLPHMLGHEGAGEVIEIGEGVSKVKPGDFVVLGWIKGLGIDAGGCQYKTKEGLIINAGAVTTFSEYAIVSENRVVPKPPNTPLHLAFLYGCAIPTGLGMVLNNITAESKKDVAFFGLGGVGLSALLSIKLFSFEKIIAVDINQEKLELAKKWGVTHIVNAQQTDPVSAIMKLTDGIGVDYSFESAGQASTIEQAFTVTRRKGGRCVFASHPPVHEKIQLDPFELICGKKIEGTWGGGSKPDEDIPRFDHYYQEYSLPLEGLLSQSYTLKQINNAIEDLKNRKITRALIII